jgi:aryl-alcohol dehydrogenase-like predicted oxidoreductase
MLALKDRDLIRWCGEHGTGVVSYGPLGYGLLTGAITAETVYAEGDFRPGDARMFGPGNLEKSLRVAEAMRPIAERLGISIAQLDGRDRRKPRSRSRPLERCGRRRRTG